MNGALRILVAVTMVVCTQSLFAASLTDKQQLGKLLYFDMDLSANKNQACASCHTPPGFADPANLADPANAVVSLGSDISLNGGRNAPTASYAAFSPFFYWDSVEGLYIGGANFGTDERQHLPNKPKDRF